MQPQVMTPDEHGASGDHEAEFGIAYGDAKFRVPCRPGRDHILDQMRRTGSFYELDLLRAIETELAGRAGICLDIGANIGNHTLFFAGVVGRRTIAFEPVAGNLDVLTRLVAMNGGIGEMVTVAACALSDEPGQLLMATLNPENPGMFRVTDKMSEGAETVEAMTLDAYLQTNGLENTCIASIKIDVEGQELQVLAGATETLASGDCILSIEIASRAIYRRILAMLTPFGFEPIDVFCATPTVLFVRGAGKKKNEGRVIARLQAHEQIGRSL